MAPAEELLTTASIIPLAEWAEQRDTALGLSIVVVQVEPADNVATLVRDLDAIDVIVVNFPTFKDGRGFSHARLLREKYGYKGKLHATGHLIRDQYLFLDRCGFDSVDAQGADLEAALGETSVFYQPTADGRAVAPRARHGIGLSAAAE